MRSPHTSLVPWIGLVFLSVVWILSNAYPDGKFRQNEANYNTGRTNSSSINLEESISTLNDSDQVYNSTKQPATFVVSQPATRNIGEDATRRTRQLSQLSTQTGYPPTSAYVSQIIQQFMPETATPNQKVEMHEYVSDATVELQHLLGQIRSTCNSIRDGFSNSQSNSNSYNAASYQNPIFMQSTPAMIQNFIENPDQIEHLPDVLQTVPSTQMADSIEKLKGSFKKMFGLLQRFEDSDYQHESKSNGKKRFDKNHKRLENSKSKKSYTEDEDDTNQHKTIIVTIPTLIPSVSSSSYPNYSGNTPYQVKTVYPNNMEYPTTATHPNQQIYSNYFHQPAQRLHTNYPDYSSYSNNDADTKQVYSNLDETSFPSTITPTVASGLLASSATLQSDESIPNSNYNIPPVSSDSLPISSTVSTISTITSQVNEKETDPILLTSAFSTSSNLVPIEQSLNTKRPYYQTPVFSENYSPASQSENYNKLPHSADTFIPHTSNYFDTLPDSNYIVNDKTYLSPQQEAAFQYSNTAESKKFQGSKEKVKLLTPRHIAERPCESESISHPKPSHDFSENGQKANIPNEYNHNKFSGQNSYVPLSKIYKCEAGECVSVLSNSYSLESPNTAFSKDQSVSSSFEHPSSVEHKISNEHSSYVDTSSGKSALSNFAENSRINYETSENNFSHRVEIAKDNSASRTSMKYPRVYSEISNEPSSVNTETSQDLSISSSINSYNINPKISDGLFSGIVDINDSKLATSKITRPPQYKNIRIFSLNKESSGEKSGYTPLLAQPSNMHSKISNEPISSIAENSEVKNESSMFLKPSPPRNIHYVKKLPTHNAENSDDISVSHNINPETFGKYSSYNTENRDQRIQESQLLSNHHNNYNNELDKKNCNEAFPGECLEKLEQSEYLNALSRSRLPDIQHKQKFSNIVPQGQYNDIHPQDQHSNVVHGNILPTIDSNINTGYIHNIHYSAPINRDNDGVQTIINNVHRAPVYDLAHLTSNRFAPNSHSNQITQQVTSNKKDSEIPAMRTEYYSTPFKQKEYIQYNAPIHEMGFVPSSNHAQENNLSNDEGRHSHLPMYPSHTSNINVHNSQHNPSYTPNINVHSSQYNPSHMFNVQNSLHNAFPSEIQQSCSDAILAASNINTQMHKAPSLEEQQSSMSLHAGATASASNMHIHSSLHNTSPSDIQQSPVSYTDTTTAAANVNIHSSLHNASPSEKQQSSTSSYTDVTPAASCLRPSIVRVQETYPNNNLNTGKARPVYLIPNHHVHYAKNSDFTNTADTSYNTAESYLSSSTPNYNDYSDKRKESYVHSSQNLPVVNAQSSMNNNENSVTNGAANISEDPSSSSILPLSSSELPNNSNSGNEYSGTNTANEEYSENSVVNEEPSNNEQSVDDVNGAVENDPASETFLNGDSSCNEAPIEQLKTVVAGIVNAIAESCSCSACAEHSSNTKSYPMKYQNTNNYENNLADSHSNNLNDISKPLPPRNYHMNTAPDYSLPREQSSNSQVYTFPSNVENSFDNKSPQDNLEDPNSFRTDENNEHVHSANCACSNDQTLPPVESLQDPSDEKVNYEQNNSASGWLNDEKSLEKLRDAVVDVVSSSVSNMNTDSPDNESLIDILGCTAATIVEALSEAASADQSKDECPAVVFGNAASAILDSIADSPPTVIRDRDSSAKSKTSPLEIISDTASIIADKVVTAVSLINSKHQMKHHDEENYHPSISDAVSKVNVANALVSDSIKTTLQIPQNPKTITAVNSAANKVNTLIEKIPLSQAPTIIENSAATLTDSTRDLADSLSSAISRLTSKNTQPPETSYVAPVYILPTYANPSSNVAVDSTASPHAQPNVFLYRQHSNPCECQQDHSQISLTVPNHEISSVANRGNMLPNDLIQISMSPQTVNTQNNVY